MKRRVYNTVSGRIWFTNIRFYIEINNTADSLSIDIYKGETSSRWWVEVFFPCVSVCIDGVKNDTKETELCTKKNI